MSAPALDLMAFALVEATKRICDKLAKAAEAKLALQIAARRIAAIKVSVTILGGCIQTATAIGNLERAIKMRKTNPPPTKTTGPLKNARHETFAQLVANGLSATQAYSKAYDRASDTGTRTSAHKLLTNPNIRQRTDQIRLEISQEATDTFSAIIAKLEATALDQIAKGHLRAACKTAQQIVSMADGLERVLVRSRYRR